MATLSANASATDRVLLVAGSTAKAKINNEYRIDDEVVELKDFEAVAVGANRIRDPRRWIVTRGAHGSTPTAHSVGAEIVAATDAFVSGSTLAVPDPFPDTSDVGGLFDATAPTTQAFGDAAAPGSASAAARRDHLHGMPAEGVAISDLPAVTTPAAADEFVVNQSGTTKKVTLGQIAPLDVFVGPVTNWGPAASSAAPTANVMYALAFTVQRSVTVSAAKIAIATQSGNVDVAILDAARVRLASTGSTAVGAAGLQSINLTAPLALSAGVKYYAAVAFDNTTVRFAYTAPTSAMYPFALAAGMTFQNAATFPIPAGPIAAGAGAAIYPVVFFA